MPRINVSADCSIEIETRKGGQNLQIGTDNTMNGVLDYPATFRTAEELTALVRTLFILIDEWPV